MFSLRPHLRTGSLLFFEKQGNFSHIDDGRMDGIMEGRMREHVLESTYLQGGYYSMQSDESSMLRSFPDGASGLGAVHTRESLLEMMNRK